MESCGGIVEKSNRVLARSSVMLPLEYTHYSVTYVFFRAVGSDTL